MAFDGWYSMLALQQMADGRKLGHRHPPSPFAIGETTLHVMRASLSLKQKEMNLSDWPSCVEKAPTMSTELTHRLLNSGRSRAQQTLRAGLHHGKPICTKCSGDAAQGVR